MKLMYLYKKQWPNRRSVEFCWPLPDPTPKGCSKWSILSLFCQPWQREPQIASERKKNQQFNCSAIFFTIVRKPFKANYDWDEIAEPFRRKEKLPNHLVINAQAHRGPTSGEHLAALTASIRERLAGDVHPREKQPRENIWIALFKYLVHPVTTAASQGWRGRACL